MLSIISSSITIFCPNTMRCISIENPPFSIDSPQVQSEAKSHAWQLVKQELAIGQVLTGKVFTQVTFGIFFDAGIGFPVRMNVTDFGIQTVEGLRFPEDYPALQSIISGKLAGFDKLNHQLVVQNLEQQSLSLQVCLLS